MHKGCKSAWKAVVDPLLRYSAGSHYSAPPQSPDALHKVHPDGAEPSLPQPHIPATVKEEVTDSSFQKKKRERETFVYFLLFHKSPHTTNAVAESVDHYTQSLPPTQYTP